MHPMCYDGNLNKGKMRTTASGNVARRPSSAATTRARRSVYCASRAQRTAAA